VYYDWEWKDGNLTNGKPRWLRRHLGPGYFEEVTSICVFSGADNALIRQIGRLPAVEDLTLIGAQLGDLEPLRSLSRLRSLNLDSTWIDDASLARLEILHSLNSLSLRGRRVTDAGMPHLCKLSGLKRLNLDETGITDEGLRGLAGLSQLEALSLNSTSVTDEGLLHLAGLKRCRKVCVGETKVTGKGIAALRATCPWITVRRPSKVFNR
jgi:Leucine-rich repeat (LRR) protein